MTVKSCTPSYNNSKLGFHRSSSTKQGVTIIRVPIWGDCYRSELLELCLPQLIVRASCDCSTTSSHSSQGWLNHPQKNRSETPLQFDLYPSFYNNQQSEVSMLSPSNKFLFGLLPLLSSSASYLLLCFFYELINKLMISNEVFRRQYILISIVNEETCLLVKGPTYTGRLRSARVKNIFISS